MKNKVKISSITCAYNEEAKIEELLKRLLNLDYLDEIFEICDRIAVLYQGTLSPLINTESASVHQIGLLMGGKTTE